ncbi:MAG: hypothetical protein ABEJ91_02710 [Candidatus Nanohaloarchaea archaeon]
MISIQTWTSATKLAALAIGLSFVVASGAAFYYADGSSSRPISGDTGFSLPRYDSQMEIATDFVAPFLLITLVLQLGLERALMFTLADDRSAWFGQPNPNYRRERKKIKKRSMILALVITGMLVPTTFFQSINDLIAIVFGGSIYLIAVVTGLAGLYFVLKSLGGAGGRGE